MSSSSPLVASPSPRAANIRSSSRMSRASTVSTCSMSTTLTKETAKSNLPQPRAIIMPPSPARTRKSQLPTPRAQHHSHSTPERKRRSLPGRSESFSKRPSSIPTPSTPQTARARTLGAEPCGLAAKQQESRGSSSAKKASTSSSGDRVSATLRRLSGGQPPLMKTPTRVPATPSPAKILSKDRISKQDDETETANDESVTLDSNSNTTANDPPPDPPASPGQGNRASMGASLSMLHTAMSDNAKAYEYLFDKSSEQNKSSEANNAQDQTGTEAASNTESSNPLFSVMQMMQQQHEEEKSKLQKDLQSAKAKSKHYKAELRENLSERLQFLEDRVMQQAQASASCDSSALAMPSQAVDNMSQLQNEDDNMLDGYRRGVVTADVEERLRQTQRELAAEKRQWAHQLDVLEQKYTGDLQSWQQEVMQLKDDSRRLLAERNQLKAQLATSSSTEEVRKQLDKSLQERDEAVTLVDELQLEVQDTRKELKELKRSHKQQIQSLGEPIDQVEAVYRESVEKRKELSERMRKMELQHSNDKATWKLQLECALANARRATTELEQSQQELEKIGETVKEANVEIEKHNNSHLQELNMVRMTHQEELEALRNAHDEELAAERAQHVEELEMIENKTNELAQQYDESDREREATLVQEFEETKADLIAQNESTQAEQEQTISQLQQDLEEAESLLQRVSERLEESQGEVMELTSELQQQSDQKDESIAEKDGTIADLENQLETTKRQLAEATEQLNKSQRHGLEKSQRHEKELSEALEAKAVESAQLKSLKTEVDSLRLQVSTSLEREEEQASAQRSEIDIAKKRHEELIASCAGLESEVSSWRDQCRRLEMELADAKKQQHACPSPTARVKEEITEWKETAAKFERSVTELMESEVQTAEKYKSQLEVLERKNRNEREENEKLTEEKAGLHRQIHTLANKYSEAEDMIQSQAHLLEETKETYQQEVYELGKEIEGLSDRIAAGTAALENETEKTKKVASECTRLEEENANLRATMQTETTKANSLSVELDAATEKADRLASELQLEVAKTTNLASSLEEINLLHKNGSNQWESDFRRLEEENADLRASMQTAESDAFLARQQVVRGLENYQKEISSTVLELRSDIAAVRMAVESSPDSMQEALNQSGLKRSVEDIHSNIYDALAEVTLETENLIECRNGLLTLLKRTTGVLDGEPQRELQERMAALEQLLAKALKQRQDDHEEQSTEPESATPLTKCMAELLFVKEQLSREQKETEDAKKTIECQAQALQEEKEARETAEADLAARKDQAEQLEFEKHMRDKAEQEIRLLNDQADAYGEELMRLHALNSNLEDTLNEAERRMESALNNPEMAEAIPLGEDRSVQDDEDDDIDSKLPKETEGVEARSEDFSSPMLDEALALAHNLTALMQTTADAEKETSVMEMLETMSNMIDSANPNDREPGIPVEVQIVKKKESTGATEADESPPIPVSSPQSSGRKASSTADLSAPPVVAKSGGELTMVVEQLYSRCQMLERERTDLMEVTLDILQSAREASSAELEAALATARRKSAEELLRVREDNQKGMWRLYHKLCGRCQHGLMEGHCQNAISTGVSHSSRAPEAMETSVSAVSSSDPSGAVLSSLAEPN